MIEPDLVVFMIVLTISLTPGRAQSRGSTDQSSGMSPSAAQYVSTRFDQAP
jgi:hypothetical protein